MRERFNPTEYSVIAKLRGTPPKPWRWEIYCAGRVGPVERGRVFFDRRTAALNEGKKALARLLEKSRRGWQSGCKISWVKASVSDTSDRRLAFEGPAQCPLSGVKQTCHFTPIMSAFDPKRTKRPALCWPFQ
jgi:hypothetical protein